MSFALYHWSPVERRGQIQKYGLVPGRLSTDRIWRPPYVCYSDSPALAWSLSGALRDGEFSAWDLWMTWSDRLEGYEVIPFDDGVPREYRVYHRVFKRDVWYVGTREC